MSFARYPTYKDSGVDWLGEVPGHWDVVQLKQFVDIQNGTDHKHVEQAEGYPVLGSGGVFTYASAFLYDGESVLLGRKGTIDKPLHVTGRFWTVDTMYWTKIRSGVSGRFSYYAALTIPFDYYSTNTALPSMTKGALNSHLVARPPLPEQLHIAAFLDRETAKIDALVAEQQRLIELLKEKRQAVISHAVTKGLNPDAPMKDSGIEWLGEVPRHWATPTLNSRYSTELGKMLDEKRVSGMHLVPYLRNVDVQWDAINLESLPEMDIGEAEYERYTVHPGDVLVCEGGEVGRAAIVGPLAGTCGFQKALHRLRPREASCESVRYLFYTFAWAALTGVFQTGGMSTIAHLTGEQLRRYRFPRPPLAEQVAIAAFLDRETSRLDTLTLESHHAIALLQERRSALISAAVTGQIDVRGTAA